MNRRTASAAGLGVALALEGLAAWKRFEARRTMFASAQQRALDLGRPLVVVGDPDAGMHTRMKRAYPCGDVCVDINGCPACPVQLIADITAERLPFEDDSVVVFVACVLEYVSDVATAATELARVAGPDNLFIVTVQPWTITAALYPGAKWHDVASGEGIDMRPVSPVQKTLYAGTLAALLAGALWPTR